MNDGIPARRFVVMHGFAGHYDNGKPFTFAPGTIIGTPTRDLPSWLQIRLESRLLVELPEVRPEHVPHHARRAQTTDGPAWVWEDENGSLRGTLDPRHAE